MLPYGGGIGGPGGWALPMLALAAMASVAAVVAIVAWLLSSSGDSDRAVDRGNGPSADDLLGKPYAEAVQYIMGQNDKRPQYIDVGVRDYINVPITVVRWGNTQTLTTRPGTVYVVVNDSGNVVQLMDSLETPSLAHGGVVARYNGGGA
jgi:hypothetical protein